MIYQTQSTYPGNVDPLLFFSDTSLSDYENELEYKTILKENGYQAAAAFFQTQNTMHGYFAELFNLIENRVRTLQQHTAQKEKINPHHMAADMPSIEENEIWIE